MAELAAGVVRWRDRVFTAATARGAAVHICTGTFEVRPLDGAAACRARENQREQTKIIIGENKDFLP